MIAYIQGMTLFPHGRHQGYSAGPLINWRSQKSTYLFASQAIA